MLKGWVPVGYQGSFYGDLENDIDAVEIDVFQYDSAAVRFLRRRTERPLAGDVSGMTETSGPAIARPGTGVSRHQRPLWTAARFTAV